MKSHEIRQAFLDYFEKNDHRVVKSSPVVPLDDPTLLFTNAGMVQFKNTFLGVEKRDYSRATSSQKCIRAGGKHNDLDNVGFTARHQTFFEMLGNFSFGDYFKEEAIHFAWEFVVKVMGFDPSRLYATVYTDDDDAEKLWKKVAPELGDRVLRFGEKDNFWSMGETGPCGPCSELHYDRGEGIPGELNGEGDRYMEIWNLVFMQYNRDDAGKMTPLPKPSVDTGAGLERFCMIMQNVDSNYSTDLFAPLLKKVIDLSGKPYDSGPDGVSHRVIADHVRALTFALADNANISNEGRGYVLRRILRRAARYGHQIGLTEPFVYKIVQPLVDFMGNVFPEIKAQRGHIELVIKTEEEQFSRTLETGIARFEDIASKADKVIPGEVVFKLYDTYGFPADLTEIMAHEKGYEIDWPGFNKELKEQQERSKDFRQAKESLIEKVGFRRQIGDPEKQQTNLSTFRGYDLETLPTTVWYIENVEGSEVIVLEETPFYAEEGGQVSDKGQIFNDSLKFEIEEVVKGPDNEIYHLGKLIEGNLPNNDRFSVTAEIDHARRADIKCNHTATHLLQKALRMVLGDHVHQSGSAVHPDRFRFDFTHFKAMTPDEINEVEAIVKDKIKSGLKVFTPENDDSLKGLTVDKAIAMGAMALFGEKYGDEVRVVKTGDFSMELCGGTHVDNTADIGRFFIIIETAIAAGTRRIEAITGTKADEFFQSQAADIAELEKHLEHKPEEGDSKTSARVKELQGKIHPRMLVKENLDSKLNDYLDKIKKLGKAKLKEIEKEIWEKVTRDPDLKLKSENWELFVFIIENATPQELMVSVDIYKTSYRDKTILTISSTDGKFAITAPESGFANEVKDLLVSCAGARGGGKPTIRGAMPKDKITDALEGLKEKYSA